MNLDELFAMQRELDTDIVKRKGLEGQDLLTNKILALQVELGELANEWRGFKFWSEDKEPRTLGFGKMLEDGIEIPCYVNPLLEEYVDCLHFILSIGLDLGKDESPEFELDINFKAYDVLGFFSECFAGTTEVNVCLEHHDENLGYFFEYTLQAFIRLGEKLGFTWEKVVQAYKEKNKINFERQANGY
ncbi:dUTP diphosphatase [Salipaludibacillus agaradhaerens]|jgi:dimeric dUTPase (all-alpha-NTP-PPase superfamily)|uniref:dUTP diphosphatase n=1 Tax=Salipaludibacillus agaradhaerens TaxID=76935 RepID=A0A9Q4FZ10_SALAG|nr:dUTP diphosphatase [Salipaludibacillus agaradhaerens]MCR6096886.1 dUTP diphosphatase [Salipaludibacillus agaradhaerens]MCR6116730.1 dUTP diphosphatase [Salipaludibacillus agaradhaerens]